METTKVTFFILAAFTVICTYGVITSRKVMHAALWLGASFIGVAGIFLVLNADFLAAAQVLVYVGAITTTIIFGVMLSEVSDIVGRGADDSEMESAGTRWRRRVLPLLVGGLFTGLMVGVYARSNWPRTMPAETLADSARTIGSELFRHFVIPFEMAAILLLVALVGAIVMASKEESN